MANLAAYGTLCIESLMHELTGRSLASRPAVILDHVRRRLRGRSYPGIVPRSGHETPAVVYEGLDDESLRILDAFEDALYQRRPVRVRLASGEVIEAMAYIVAELHATEMTDEPWELDAFVQTEQGAFYASYVGDFRRRWQAVAGNQP